LISSAGCRTPGPMGKSVAGGGDGALTPPAAVSWQSQSTFTAGRLQLDFELGARARARILPDPDLDKILSVFRPTEP
ncbi:unnamed protein product, partial [marine sediment metagenome]